MWQRDVNEVMTGSVSRDLRKVSLLNSSVRRDGWLSELTEPLWRVPHVMVVVVGADGKVVIERLCLSLPYVVEPFNSKVIKSFVPELRSCKCFLCFGIPMFIYIWVMNILCTFHIFMYGDVKTIHIYVYTYIWLCKNHTFPIFMYGYVTEYR